MMGGLIFRGDGREKEAVNWLTRFGEKMWRSPMVKN